MIESSSHNDNFPIKEWCQNSLVALKMVNSLIEKNGRLKCPITGLV